MPCPTSLNQAGLQSGTCNGWANVGRVVDGFYGERMLDLRPIAPRENVWWADGNSVSHFIPPSQAFDFGAVNSKVFSRRGMTGPAVQL